MKVYVKPELFYERYELSQHVAACAWDKQDNGTFKADAEFGYLDDLYLFTDASLCNVTNVEEYCYTNGEVGKNQFNS